LLHTHLICYYSKFKLNSFQGFVHLFCLIPRISFGATQIRPFQGHFANNSYISTLNSHKLYVIHLVHMVQILKNYYEYLSRYTSRIGSFLSIPKISQLSAQAHRRKITKRLFGFSKKISYFRLILYNIYYLYST
jgi:hypothetical protein